MLDKDGEMDRGNKRIQYAIVTAVSLSGVFVGISFSWATPVLPKFERDEVGFQITKGEISWMVAISSIGYILGSFIARYVTDRFGRRVSILASSIPTVIAIVLKIFAWEAWMLCSARFLMGCGTGFVLSAAMMYLGEISDKEIRGKISLTNRFMMSFGCLIVISVGAFVSYSLLNYLLLPCAVLYVIACWWIPESPYYLLKEGKVDAARKTLQMLTGIIDESVLEEKISEMRAQVKIEMSRSNSLKELITGQRYRKAVIVVFGVKLTQIMSGIHPLQNYIGTIILESHAGIDITTALIIFGACRFLLGILSSLLVDRVGRRPLLIYSYIGTGILLGAVALYYAFWADEAQYPYTLIPFIGIISALTISVLGYESVSYIMPGELFPLNVKALAVAMYSLFGGLMNFLSVKSYQPIKDLSGFYGLFTFYAVSALIGGVFSYFLVPETKGKSLREIQVELQGDLYDDHNGVQNKILVAENEALKAKSNDMV